MILHPNSSENNCDFCHEISDIPSLFSTIYRDVLPSRILTRQDDFTILPSIGQLVPGYLLIVNNTHYTSSQQLPLSAVQSLCNIFSMVESIIRRVYNSATVFFEHGMPSFAQHCGGCGISHHHIHAVPINNSINIIDHVDDMSFDHLSLFSDVLSIPKTQPYLFIRDTNGKMLISYIDHLPSQYMRRIISRSINSTDSWDWRKYSLENTLVDTYRTLYPYFQGK